MALHLIVLSEESDFQVALRALGHDIDAKENEALKLMFPDGTVVFGEYLKLLSQWILNIDQDLDVKKAFSLFDTDEKGYIDLDDLRRVRDRLGYSQEIDDAELINMLIGSQVSLETPNISNDGFANKKPTTFNLNNLSNPSHNTEWIRCSYSYFGEIFPYKQLSLAYAFRLSPKELITCVKFLAKNFDFIGLVLVC